MLGIARRALDEVIDIAGSKILMPQSVRMRDVPRVHADLAIAQMHYRAARAYSLSAVEGMWQELVDGRQLRDDVRVDMLLSRVHAARMARDVTLQMVQLAGTQRSTPPASSTSSSETRSQSPSTSPPDRR